MVKQDEKDKEIDLEERFRFVKMDDYRMKNINYHNNMDTLEYQYHTSSDNIQFPLSRVSFDSKAKAPFALPNQTLEEKNEDIKG